MFSSKMTFSHSGVDGCEGWSLILRKERRLRVFENRVLRRIFGAKRDEVTGEWRKHYNEQLYDRYSPNIVWVIKVEKNEVGRACSADVEGSCVYRAVVGKPKGKKPLGRPRRRWDDNINMDLQEMEFGVMDWIELAQDRDM
jgi:hypothetical protein